MIACTGGDKCCSSDDKCGVDEGDCDKDEDCQDGLICGKNNCSNKSGEEWDDSDDCCYAPSKRWKYLNWKGTYLTTSFQDLLNYVCFVKLYVYIDQVHM